MIDLIPVILVIIFTIGLMVNWSMNEKKNPAEPNEPQVTIRPENSIEEKLTQLENELNEVMRRTKYGLWGEHVVTHRHINRALEIVSELRKEVK